MLRELYDHMQWADAVVWRAALAHPPAAGDERLRRLLTHLHMVQRAFLSVWRGEAPEFRDDFGSLAEVMQWGRGYHHEVRGHLDAIDEAALRGAVTLPWAARFTQRFGRQPEQTTLHETMMQVVLHSTYHRGQVNARLRELGAEPPLTDYIAWLWLGKPRPDWP